MAITNDKRRMRDRRRMRIRKKVRGTAECPRLAVFRSAKHVQVQLVDDVAGRSLMGLASYSPELSGQMAAASGKTARSREVGKAIAAKALEAGIKDVVFDRGGYLYHGRVQALAEGAREGGLNF